MINEKFHKTTLSLHDIPSNPDLIASIINWAFRANIEELTGNKPPEGYVLHMTISAIANVNGYDIETNKPKSYRGDRSTNMLALGVDILNRKISKKEITKWLRENEEHFQRMLEKSDMYAEIENISEMNINFKMTEISGEGFVSLKNPEEFPNIFSPLSEADCFFLCLEEAGLKFKTGMTLHQIKQELSIGSSVSIRKIGEILKYLSKSVQVIIHNAKNGSFPIKKSNCSRIPHDAKDEMTSLHIGHISGHYFLIKDTKDLKKLSSSDFEIFATKNDKLINELDTNNPVRVNLMERAGGKPLWEGKSISEAPISDETIKKRINSYQKQDKEAGRKVCDLSIEEVRNLLSFGKCYKCSHPITHNNWTLDRKSNVNGHSFNNLRLCCFQCNVKKKDKEQQIFTWDTETYPKKISNEHIIYNAGITEYDIDDLENKEYQKLKDSTIIFYGEDATEMLENWFIEKSEEIRTEVDKLLNSWIEWYQNNKFEDDKKKLRAEYGRKIEKNPQKADEIEEELQEELDELLDKKIKIKRSKLTNNHKAIFYAHNGSKFDNQFIFKSKRLQFDEVIDSFGLIQVVLKGGYIEFRDSMRITGLTSLDSLCKNFNLPVEFSKTEFPHEFACAENLNYIGETPEAKFWPSKQIPEEHKDKLFNFKETSISYQKLDCVSLCIILHLLWKAVYSATNFSIFDFLTGPSLAYRFVLEKTPPNSIYICSDRSTDAWIRSSIQGGRCFPQKSYFKSSFADEIHKVAKSLQNNDQQALKELHNLCDDYLDDLDAVSLYPSAMNLFEYPIGNPYWEHNVELVCGALNSCDANFPLGIVECEISPDKDNICPLLSHISPDGRLLYTLEPKQRLVKTTIDIMEAVKHNGAVVSQVFYALLWKEKAPILSEGIGTLFRTRQKAKKEKNDSLDQSAKLLMNSSYGKFDQGIRDNIILISDDNSEIDKYYQKGQVITDITLSNEEQCLLDLCKRRISNVKDPSHIGCFILAYSKVIMNRFIDAFDGFTDWDKTLYYTDTDSMFIHHNQFIELEQKRPDIIGKEMGQIHDDISEVNQGKIIRAIFLAPKLYICEIIGYSKKKGEEDKIVIEYHIRGKGVPKDNQKELTFEVFEDMLFNQNSHIIKEGRRFAKAFKKTEAPAIKTVYEDKEINREEWKGRKLNRDSNRWIPLSENNDKLEEILSDVEEEKEVKDGE